MNRKVVFILSSGRSGSTWLGYVLGSTPKAAFLGEYYRGWEPSLRVPCSWCAAHRLEVCPVLNGLEALPVEDAFAFAFERIPRRILVDNSKDLSWAGKFTCKDPRYDVTFIHLMRDPRGWYESEHRRQPDDVAAYCGWWVQQQRKISRFVAASQRPFTTVFYDELAQSPLREIAKLCRLLAIPFDPECLKYWQTPQHGFAANGASSLLLSPIESSFRSVVTGDDEYYRARQKQVFVDKRWLTNLGVEKRRAIEQHQEIAEVLNSYGRTLSAAGISRI